MVNLTACFLVVFVPDFFLDVCHLFCGLLVVGDQHLVGEDVFAQVLVAIQNLLRFVINILLTKVC